jgi:hypothetical protein
MKERKKNSKQNQTPLFLISTLASEFEVIHGLLDRVMQVLNVPREGGLSGAVLIFNGRLLIK